MRSCLSALLVVLCIFGSVSLCRAEITLAPVAAFQLKDYRGHEVGLSDFEDKPVVVVAFLGTQCPLAKLYAVRLEEFAKTYADKGVQVLGINSNVQDPVSRISAFVRQHGITYPMLKDPGNTVADLFKAERTPEIFVLDSQRIVRYRGRVDDQYVVGLQRDKADREDLKLAIDEILAGQQVSVARTEVYGCLIGRAREPKADSPVTYAKHIAPLFQDRCVSCHREGEIAPFNLTSYEEAAGWGEMIAEVVHDGRMPPWHAAPGNYHFSNDRSLSADEKHLISTWVKNGCPEGNPAELPAPKTFVDGWNLPRDPDVVIAMRDKPFVVPADAGPEGVAYQNFWVDPHFTEDKWIQSAEVRPGNRAVVHHIIVYAHPEGRGKGSDIFLFAYVPGLRLEPLPPGAAKKVPAGSQLRFQVHYTPIGSVQEDMSVVGLIYANPADITHEVRTTEVGNTKFEIEPYKKDQKFEARSQASPVPLQLLSLSPHMHLRGQSFTYQIEHKDGSRETLLDVPHYDFNWQTQYRLSEPYEVPAGARMYCTALFDNSERNLANPDPSAVVKWGDQSWDEMMIGYFDVLVPLTKTDGVGEKPFRGNGKPLQTGLNVPEILKKFDKNGDGKLSRDESQTVPVLAKAFDKVDANRDGFTDVAEIDAALERLRKRQP